KKERFFAGIAWRCWRRRGKCPDPVSRRVVRCAASRPRYGRSDMASNKKTTKSRLRKDQPPPEANGMPAAAGAQAGKAAAPKARHGKGKKEPRAKKTSALDAAASVLAQEGKALNCQDMMAA